MADAPSQQLGLSPFFSTDFGVSPPPIKNMKEHVAVLRRLGLVPKRLVAPMFVLMDITGECNMKCPYCYNESGRSRVARMDRATMLRIADELARMKVFSVCICGGEPTLHPDFVEILRRFRKNGVVAASITNGHDVEEDIAREMARNLAIVQVTIDGPDAREHDRLRGRGSFDRAMRTVEKLKRHKVRHLRIAFTCTKKNAHSFPRMLDLCLEIGAHDLRTMPLVPVGRAFDKNGLVPSVRDLSAVKASIGKWNLDRNLMGRISVEWGMPHEHIKIGLIYGYVVGINISPEGYYKITPYLPLAFGNAHKVPLDVAWRLGLGQGWLLPKARPIFGSIRTVNDYAPAYAAIMNDEHVENGHLDLFPKGVYRLYGH